MRPAIAAAIDLYFLDESGFAPPLPPGYTGARAGTRAIVPYVAPQGRRVNVIGALAPHGPDPRLAYQARSGKIDSTAFTEFLWRDVARLPAAPVALPAGYRRARPCVIVMDNYSVHRSAVVKEMLPALEAAGVHIFYLPPYSPELNSPIESLGGTSRTRTCPSAATPTPTPSSPPSIRSSLTMPPSLLDLRSLYAKLLRGLQARGSCVLPSVRINQKRGSRPSARA